MNFVASTDPLATLELMNLLQTEMNGPPASASASIRSWGLLATSLPSTQALSLFKMIPTLYKLLEHPDLDVRLMAGEDVALLVEFARDQYLKNSPDENGDGDGEEQLFDLHTMDAASSMDVTQVLERLNELASERGRHQNKKEQQKQRVGFREIALFVEAGEFEPQTLSFNKSMVSFDTWVQAKQLEALRNALGEGLQEHFIANELLQEIFDAHVRAEKGRGPVFSAVEKRMIQSPNSTQNKARSRALRSRGLKSFLTDDDF